MSEGAASAQGAGEGAAASAGQSNDGNPADVDNNSQAGAGGDGTGGEGGQNDSQAKGGEGEGGAGGEGQGGDDDLSDLGVDPSDKRALKHRFKTLAEQRREAEDAARRAEQEAAYWRGKAEARSDGEGGKPKTPARVDPNPKPDPNDKEKYPLGKDDPNFIIDQAKYEIKAEQQAERAEQERKAAAQADFNERRDNYLRAVEAAKANADTPNAAKQLGAMVPAITDLVAVSPHAALIAEHLHNKPEEYRQLVRHVGEDGRLTPKGLIEVSRRIGALETSLPGAFASKKVTKAATPPEQVGGGGAAAPGNSLERIAASGDSDAYRRWRQEHPNG